MNSRSLTNIVVLLVSLIVVASATSKANAQAHANDIQLLLINSRLTTTGGTYAGSLNGRVFEGSFPRASGQTGDPGFGSAAEFLASGEKIRFDFVREVLYWNGTALTQSPRSVTATTLAGLSSTLSPTDFGGKAGVEIGGGDVLTGAFHHHLNFSFGGSNAPNGVYGLIMTLGAAGTASFGTSEPFLIAFHRGSSGLNPAAGVDAMAALVAVPEPSTLVLAVAGIVAGFVRRQRRRAGTLAKRTGVASTISVH